MKYIFVLEEYSPIRHIYDPTTFVVVANQPDAAIHSVWLKRGVFARVIVSTNIDDVLELKDAA
jgi:transposase